MLISFLLFLLLFWRSSGSWERHVAPHVHCRHKHGRQFVAHKKGANKTIERGGRCREVHQFALNDATDSGDIKHEKKAISNKKISTSVLRQLPDWKQLHADVGGNFRFTQWVQGRRWRRLGILLRFSLRLFPCSSRVLRQLKVKLYYHCMCTPYKWQATRGRKGIGKKRKQHWEGQVEFAVYGAYAHQCDITWKMEIFKLLCKYCIWVYEDSTLQLR